MSWLSLQHWVRRLPGVLGVSGVLGALLLNMGATHVMAQDYPSKPIRMWIPSSAGGATDVAARILGVRFRCCSCSDARLRNCSDVPQADGSEAHGFEIAPPARRQSPLIVLFLRGVHAMGARLEARSTCNRL